MSIVASGIYKIFGPDPGGAVDRLRSGTTRDELRSAGVTVAVNDASFEIADGEFFVIMGLSGSGKSTLIRTLNRLHEPTAGTVEVNGVDISSLDAKELRELRAQQMSMVFQHFALLPHRTVRENAAFGLQVLHVPTDEARARADAALERVGLDGWGDSLPGELSGGMRQRVGLARALATDADILLMDEAFSALDPLIKREMQDLLIELQAELKRTVVFITHDLNEAMRLGDRIAVMRDGSIVQIGTAEEILQRPADDYVASFVQDVDRSRVLTAEGIMRKAVATVGRWEGPTSALRKMEALQVSGLYVLSRDHRLLGMVDDETVAKATNRGVEDLGDLLDASGVETVAPDTLLGQLLIPAATNRVPIAVVDDERVLLGVIPRAALLEGLSDTSGRTDAVDAAGTTSGGEPVTVAAEPQVVAGGAADA